MRLDDILIDPLSMNVQVNISQIYLNIASANCNIIIILLKYLLNIITKCFSFTIKTNDTLISNAI